MSSKINIDGVGHAGIGVLKQLVQVGFLDGQRPPISLRDFGTWRPHHAAAGLVPGADVGHPKVHAAARCLWQAGWSKQVVQELVVDIRDCPRGSYVNSVTFGLTDSHACKHESVAKALQVGAPAITIGLGHQEAVVEFFAPGGPQYCCVHGNNPEWTRRQPCLISPAVSTTQITASSRETVAAACRLAVRVAVDYIATSEFPGNTGAHLRDGVVEWFTFGPAANCEGPHDTPFATPGADSLVVNDRPGHLQVHELLAQAGEGARYADRDIAWKWRCGQCNGQAKFVHVVHPTATCPKCGVAMVAGLERASGLSGDELIRLNGGRPITLAKLGLEEERVLRLTGADGNVIWLQVDGGQPS